MNVVKWLLLVASGAVAGIVVIGCSNTRTIIGVDGYGQNYTEVREQRFLIKSTGKNNSALKEGDGFVVEYKSDSESGDNQMIEAIATGVAIGMRTAAAPTVPYK